MWQLRRTAKRPLVPREEGVLQPLSSRVNVSCDMFFRKRKGSPVPGTSSGTTRGPARRKQKTVVAKTAVADADEGSGSSEEGVTTSAAAATRDHHVAGRGMFSQYFSQPSSSSSRSSSVARYVYVYCLFYF